MKILRIGIATLLTLAVSGVPSFAGDLSDSVSAAAAAAAKTDPQETPMRSARTANKTMFWSGTAMFAGGMTYGLFEFINNENGSYSEFGEATATNKKAGAAGLTVAFAGGALMLLGVHGKSLPSLTFGGGKTVGLSKKVSW